MDLGFNVKFVPDLLRELEQKKFLAGHRERLEEFSRRNSDTPCLEIGEYIVCTDFVNGISPVLADFDDAAKRSAEIVGEISSSQVFVEGVPLLWEAAMPVVEALTTLQTDDIGNGIVVGVDPSSKRFFVHVLPRYATTLISIAARANILDEQVVKWAMGFDEHYEPGETLVPGVRYRVQGNLTMEPLRVYPAAEMAVEHFMCLSRANTITSLTIGQFMDLLEIAEGKISEDPDNFSVIHPGVLGYDHVNDPRVIIEPYQDPLIGGLNIIKYYTKTINEQLRLLYAPSSPCNPYNAQCGGHIRLADNATAFLLSNLYGSGPAIFPDSYFMLKKSGSKIMSINTNGIFRLARYLAIKSSEKERPPLLAKIRIRIENHNIETVGRRLVAPYIETYAKIAMLINLSRQYIEAKEKEKIRLLSRIVSMKENTPILLSIDKTKIKHKEHGKQELKHPPILVKYSLLNTGRTRVNNQ